MRPRHAVALVTGIAGLVAGFLVGNALGRPGDAARDETTTTSAAVAEPGTLGSQVRAVQGWEVVVARADEVAAQGATVIETWQSDWHSPSPRGAPSELRLVAWNVDRSRIAGFDAAVRPALYMGRGDSLDLLAVGVESFAWHTTDSNAISWTDLDGNLWFLDIGEEPVLVATGLGSGAQVLLAADWGYAVFHDDVIDELDAGGGLSEASLGYVSRGYGFPAAGRPAGVFGTPTAPSALLDPATGRRIDVAEPFDHAIVAPDGRRYAVTSPAGLGETRLRVYTSGAARGGDDALLLDLTLPDATFLDWRDDVILMSQSLAEPDEVGTRTVQPLLFIDLERERAVAVDYEPGFVAGATMRDR